MKVVQGLGVVLVGMGLSGAVHAKSEPSAPAHLTEAPRYSDQERATLADRKRDEAIEGFLRLLPKVEEGTPRKAELLYQLSELYWEKSKYLNDQEMQQFSEEEKRYDEAQAKGEKVKAPVESHAGSERYRAEVMGLYEQLLDKYPAFPRRDEVLFSLGFHQMELGKRKDGIARYSSLIKEHPKSEFVPDAYLQLGNHYFENNQLAQAREFFEKARASQVPKTYAYAVYKLAWCDYNAGEYEKGLKKLHEVVDYAAQKGRQLGDLKTEALNDLALFYVQLDRPTEAKAYFAKHAAPKQQARLIAKVAEGMIEAGHFPGGIQLYRALIDDAPMGPLAPEFQQAIVRAHEGLRQRAQVRVEMKRMVDLYSLGGDWWKANQGDKGVLRSAFDVTEEALRVMVTEYHQEAQKTHQVETYRLARDIYREYLATFASSSDPAFVADAAFNMHFFYAEILWALEEWEPAAQAYDAVVVFKIPDRESAKEVSEEKHRERAAYAAILAYDKLVKMERGLLAKSQLKDGQKVDEKKNKGAVEKSAPLVKRDAKEEEEQPLSALEGKLVAACDTYNRLYPKNKDEIDLRYQAAVVFYDRAHFLEAARRFKDIITRFPEERRSQDAADLTLYVLEARGEWQELNALSREFLKNPKLAPPGSDFAKRVAVVVEGSQYKWVDEVIYKREKNPQKAAEGFLQFAAEFPKSDNAPRALTYAMIIFQDARQLDRGVQVGEQVLREYRTSPFELKARYTLAGFYERVAEFRKAAAMYEAFVEAYDKASAKTEGGKSKGKPRKALATASTPSEKEAERAALVKEAAGWVPDALFNAGLWWEGLGESQKSVAAYNAYLERFKDRSDLPQIAFNVGNVYEKEKRWNEAAKSYASFRSSFAKDRRASPAQQFLARYRELRALRELKREGDAERTMAELNRDFSRLPAKDKEDPQVRDAYAHARFLEIEPTWQAYSQIRFTQVANLRRDLAAKQREMQKLEKAYIAVLGIGSGEWGIAALARIGISYADFARNIVESPNPRGLTEEQQEVYRAELENLSMPLEEKATEALDKALAKAYELALYNDWTLQAQEQINRYQPGYYSQVRELPFRGSESFVPSTLAMDETEISSSAAHVQRDNRAQVQGAL